MKAKTLAFLGLLITLTTISITACSTGEQGKGNTSTQAQEQGAQAESTSTKGDGTYKTATAEEAYALINSDTTPIIVDVRTEEEFVEKHIDGALLIPNETIDKEPPALLPDKDAAIYIYCRSGNRSRQAAEKLLAIGYTNVVDFGGINDWPYETVSGWNNEKPLKEGETPISMANFTATDIDGNSVDQTVFADAKLTMINIWATFCGPCLREMPDLGQINEVYKEKGVKVVGIVADANNGNVTAPMDQLALAREIITKTNANYLHILPSEDLIKAKLQDVQVVPETIFVDSKGNIVGDSHKGAKSKAEWEAIIDDTLKLVKS